MKYETARRRAQIRALRYGRYTITSESQTDTAWVFSFGDPSGESVTANLPMFVYDKEGGRLPRSSPSFKRGVFHPRRGEADIVLERCRFS